MGDLTVKRIEGKTFGATITGVDLRKLSDDEFAAIRASFLEHGFLLFPDQHLDEEASADSIIWRSTASRAFTRLWPAKSDEIDVSPRSCGVIRPWSAIIAARWIRFSSSRTLPGQL